jgi:hypothetical protein
MWGWLNPAAAVDAGAVHEPARMADPGHRAAVIG